MMMACQSMEIALRRVPIVLERERGELGLVLGTNSGEIEASSEFILTFAKSKLARPVLFQNSLHNATAGFASIHFGLTGPVFTLSGGDHGPGEAVHLAKMLLEQGQCRAVMVTLVEGHKFMADFIGQNVGEGACTLIFANPDFADELNLASRTADLIELSSPFEVRASHAPLYDISASPFFRIAYDSQSL